MADDASEVDERDEAEEGGRTVAVRFPHSIVVKPKTAPQIHRVPVFDNNSIDSSPKPPKSASPEACRSPTRPSSSRPQSRANPVSGHKKTVSVENRVLLKLASVLPGQSEGLGRLPESRANLVKLNTDLDAVIEEIRMLEAAQNKFAFSLIDRLPGDSIVSHMEHGTIMYDSIIAELTAQATKKVGRVRRFYGSYLQRLRSDHNSHVSSMQLEIEQVRSQLHESSLRHPFDSLTIPPERESAANGGVVSGGSVAIGLSESEVVAEPVSPGRSLHDFVVNRLEQERKIAREQVHTLADELSQTQQELQQARRQIQELSAQLQAKEREELSAEQGAIKQLQSLLAELRPGLFQSA